MVLLFFIIMGIDLVEAWAFGHLARQLNLKVRQSLGRMFGFTLDAFGQISTVAALNLEPRLVSDYRLFARDYFTCARFRKTLSRPHARPWGLALDRLLAAFLSFQGLKLQRTTSSMPDASSSPLFSLGGAPLDGLCRRRRCCVFLLL